MNEVPSFCKYLLFVTGKGEQSILPKILGTLCQEHPAAVLVARRVPQLSPREKDLPRLRIAGTKAPPHCRDDEIGLAIRRVLLSDPQAFAILVDDLESARAPLQREVFSRYRAAIDRVIADNATRERASVHFLVPMLEAYYFADVQALNSALGLSLPEPEADVETLGHPKNDLKRLSPGFDEIRDGERVAARINLDRVLSRPDSCASLRTLVAWCVRRGNRPFDERWQLAQGRYNPVTAGQIPV